MENGKLKKYKLGELCKENEIGIYGIPATAEEFSEKKIRYLRITDISDDGILLDDDKKSVSDENIEKYILHEGDIVFARTGNSTGRTYLYDEKDGTLAFAGFLIKYGLDKNKVNPKFLRYYTIGNTYKQWVKNLSVGSTRGNISAKTFTECPISLPDRKQQDLTVAVLSALDDKIALNRRMNAKLEQMAKRLYDHWFVQFDFPNADGKPYKASGGKMVYSDVLKREISAGWEVKKLGTLFTTNRGVSYSTKTITGDKGIPMINLASFSPDGSYKIDGIKTYTGEYTNEKVLKPFDLVMCNTQQTAIDFSKDIIGKALLVPDIFEGNITSSHHVNTLNVHDEKLKFYLYRLFNTDYFHAYISHYASGTNIMGLDFAGVENYSAVIPSKEVLSKFADFTLNIEKKKSEIIRENKKLISLRDRLLPLLMNGQVEVK